jgi:hypothetical protein
MAASTSARVISADAISGDARSTCCIMPWEAAGMADARPNIPIAPIQIDARIIVSLYFGGCRPRIHYRPGAIGATTSAITLLDAAAITYFIATRACAESDGLNVFGCGRLVARIGFLRASGFKYVRCNGSPDVCS